MAELYNIHRPTEFSHVAGNKNTINVLENFIEKGNAPHCYLFTGESGCGKTTIGRILAEKLGVVGNDFREINSANMNGIATSREIIKQAQFKPLEGKVRVWLIDECHKMTGDAQNALLKILEDTPKHVYFILCTTDPQKLLAAVKNRCQQFQVTSLDDQQIYRILRRTVKAENEVLDKEVYDQIIQDSVGTPRLAMQILQQVLSVDEDKRLETAKQKAAEYSEGIALCKALLNGKSWKVISGILKGLKTQEPEGIRRLVLGYCQSVLQNGSDNPMAGLMMQEFLEPTYNSGMPQITYACYSVFKNK